MAPAILEQGAVLISPLTFAVMTPPPGGSYPAWFMPTQLVLIGVIFWFLLLRPQRKQQKELEALLAGLKKGDEVVTTGGMYGSIVQVQDGIVTLQVADGVRMRFAVSSIGSVTPTEAAAKS